MEPPCQDNLWTGVLFSHVALVEIHITTNPSQWKRLLQVIKLFGVLGRGVGIAGENLGADAALMATKLTPPDVTLGS